MRNVFAFCLAFLFVTMFACKKEQGIVINEGDDLLLVNAYYPLQTGNYWVYEFRNKLPDGTFTGSAFIDTLIVVGDTLIDNETFSVFHTDRPSQNSVWTFRDSSGYIINTNGIIVLPPAPVGDIFNAHYGTMSNGDTLYYGYSEYPELADVSTYIGNEECFAHYFTHEIYPAFGGNTTVDTTYYGSFGPVQRSYAFASGPKMFGTLIDHHLE